MKNKLLPFIYAIIFFNSASLFAASFIVEPYLIYPGDPSQMTVLWRTDDLGESPALLEWGTESGVYSYSADVYIYEETIYKHRITELPLGTKIYYRVILDSLNEFSGHFYTAPADTSENLVFYVWGDSRPSDFKYEPGRAGILKALVEDMNEDMDKRNTFVIHTGDAVNDDKYEKWVRHHFADNAPYGLELMSHTPVMIARGNHEKDAIYFSKYFPYNESEPAKRYYCFEYGPVFIMVIDQYEAGDEYQKYAISDTQRIWIETKLSETKKKIKIVAYHYGSWTTGKYKGSELAQELTSSVFIPNNVTAVVSGHCHNYSRAMDKGIPHLTIGAGGAPLYSVSMTDEDRIAFAESSFSYARMEVVNSDRLIVTAMRLDNSIMDQIEVTSPTTADNDPPPVPEEMLSPFVNEVIPDNYAVLQWRNSSDLSSIRYEIQIDDAKAIIGGRNPKTLIENLSNGQHTWRVRAIEMDNKNNFSTWSTRRTFTVDNFIFNENAPDNPVPVRPLDYMPIEDNSPTIMWRVSGPEVLEDLSHFEIVIRDTDRDNIKINEDIINIGKEIVRPHKNPFLGYTLHNIPAGNYDWKIRAVKIDGSVGEWSKTMRMVMRGSKEVTNPPSIVNLLSPSNNKTLFTSTPTFNWTESFDQDGIDHYIIKICDSEEMKVAGISYTPPPLAAGSYTWAVKAVDSKGDSGAWSSQSKYTISADENIIQNGDFSEKTDHWENIFSNAAKGSSIITNADLKVDIAGGGSSDMDIRVVQKGVAIEKGVKYTVSINTRCAVGSRNISICIREESASNTLYSRKAIGINSKLDTYTFSFVAPATNSDAQFALCLGGEGENGVIVSSIKMLNDGPTAIGDIHQEPGLDQLNRMDVAVNVTSAEVSFTFPETAVESIQKIKLHIFNIMGIKVFETHAMQFNNPLFWDRQQIGGKAIQGVYLYKLEMISWDSSQVMKHGSFVVM